jgi:dynamin 1-like protein
MLNGHVVPLKLGFIGVINRSQQDIISKKPIESSLKEEAEYFRTHPQYRNIASRLGTPYLAKTLNKILLHHIRDTLPDLKAKVSKLMQEKHLEMISYGDSFSHSANARGALLLQILTRFAADYRDAIEGKLTEISLNELCGGARINYIFNEIFGICLNTIQPTDGLTVNDIRTAIRNATGPRAALFVPEVSFELLVKKQITRLEEPSLQCVELVFDELQRIVTQLESKELSRFQTLKDRVVETVNQLLVKCRGPTKRMINDLINIEMSYINTNHPDFVGGGGAINSIFEKMAIQAAQQNQQMQQQEYGQNGQYNAQYNGNYQQNPAAQPNYGNQPPAPQGGQKEGVLGMFFSKDSRQGPPVNRSGGKAAAPGPAPRSAQNTFKQAPPSQQSSSMGGFKNQRLDQVPATIKAANTPTDKEQFETDLIQSLLVSYFDIVRKNIKDLVPKAIMHFLVNTSRDTLQHELVSHLYKEDLFSELLEESPIIAEKREACQKMLDVLRKANEVLNEVRDFNVK